MSRWFARSPLAACLFVLPPALAIREAAAQDLCPIVNTDYRKTILVPRPQEPMKMAVLPDGRVLWTERPGRVQVYLPATNSVSLAGTLEVDDDGDQGLHGIVADPGFAANQWIYMAYDPRTDSSADGEGRQLSRFTMVGDLVDMASEKRLLHFKIDRDVRRACCHQGGALTFDNKGNLYMSSGENSDYNWEYANVSEVSSFQNSLKSSANTNDLRGKVVRIHPEADGSYSVPAGNMFPKGLAKTRPEIYAMGLRQPWSLSYDDRRGWLWVGEVGPDARLLNADKGPAGFDEINLLKGPANLGHPYITGVLPERDYDFAAMTPKDFFDPNNLQNNSVFNTGLTDLNAAAGKPLAPLIWWTARKEYNTDFPQMGQDRTAAMVGPTYKYNAASTSAVKLPASMDGKLIFWNYEREWIKVLATTAEGRIIKIDSLATDVAWRGITDIQAGPDGALYIAEYGHGFYSANPEARISRLEYIGKPCASAIAPHAAPAAPEAQALSPRLALPGAEGLSVEMPEGAAGFEALTLEGRRLWRSGPSRERAPGSRVQVPASALPAPGGALVLIRFF